MTPLPARFSGDSSVAASCARRCVSGLASGVLLVVAAAVASSCVTTRCDPSPRPAQALPAHSAQRFEAPRAELVSLQPLEKRIGVSVQRGVLRIEGQELQFYCYLPRPSHAAPPFLTVLPILGGGEEINEMVCARLARRGIAAGTLERRWRIFKESETVAELEEKLVSAVRQQRTFLGWIAERSEIDGAHIGAFGLSVGGMVATVLAAVDERIQSAIVCLAGGDLGSLVVEADEIKSLRWVQERCALDGITPDELTRRIRAEVGVDPALFAAFVDPRRVLFASARFDGVVPHRNIELLWRALGKPERITLPFGHYSSILLIDSIVASAVRFSQQRFGIATERRSSDLD